MENRCPVCGDFYYLTACICQAGKGMPRHQVEVQEAVSQTLSGHERRIYDSLRRGGYWSGRVWIP